MTKIHKNLESNDLGDMEKSIVLVLWILGTRYEAFTPKTHPNCAEKESAFPPPPPLPTFCFSYKTITLQIFDHLSNKYCQENQITLLKLIQLRKLDLQTDSNRQSSVVRRSFV